MKRSWIKRKKGFKPSTGFTRKAAEEKVYAAKGNRTKAFKVRTPLKKLSRSRRREMTEYFNKKKDYLKRYPACAICACQGIAPAPATEVHHARGRIKALLNDERFWVPSCRSCREVPHSRPAWAREMGILASPVDWNTSPHN